MPSREKVPLVPEHAEEPDLGSVDDEDDRSDNFGDGERDKRRPGVRVVSSGTMQDVGKVIREMARDRPHRRGLWNDLQPGRHIRNGRALTTESVALGETEQLGRASSQRPASRWDVLRSAVVWFVAAEVIAFPLLLVWGRHGWFTQDDWDFLSARTAGNVGDLFRAHFQHWTTLPVLVYRLMWVVVGMRSYTPYQALIVTLHLVAAALVLVVMRRAGVRPWLATVAAVAFLFFGPGAENILVAFQITFVGSLVFGLTQLVAADHDGPIARRDWLGLLAGFAGLLCSGVAVTMTIIVGFAVLLRRGRRGWRVALFHTAPLGVAYALWSKLAPKGQNAENYRSQSPTQITKFMLVGFEATFARLGHVAGIGVALAIVGVVGLALMFRTRGRHAPLGELAAPIALLAGSAVFLIVTGVAPRVKAGCSRWPPEPVPTGHATAVTSIWSRRWSCPHSRSERTRWFDDGDNSQSRSSCCWRSDCPATSTNLPRAFRSKGRGPVRRRRFHRSPTPQ